MSRKIFFNIDGEPVVQIKKDGGTTIKGGTLKFNEDVSLEEIIINLENRISVLENEIATIKAGGYNEYDNKKRIAQESLIQEQCNKITTRVGNTKMEISDNAITCEVHK